jgi:hypothetical protein
MQNDSHILGVYLTYLLFSFPELSKNKIVCPLIHHFYPPALPSFGLATTSFAV